jgi:type VI secretion system secreted protein VgrG
VTSQDNIAIGAQTHVDVVSIGNTQLSVGRKLLARVSENISLFAHRLGIKLIAASGKLELQTHSDDIELTSSKRIVLTATDEIVLQAPKLRFVAQGAQVDIGGGAITQQSSGDHTIKSSKFAHVGPGDGSPVSVPSIASESAHDQQTVLRWIGTDEPMKNQRYRITTEDGRTFEGRTDAAGLTERFTSAIPFGRYSIEALRLISRKNAMTTAEHPLPAQQNNGATARRKALRHRSRTRNRSVRECFRNGCCRSFFCPGLWGRICG